MAREQTATALSYIHSWSRIQDQIRARRLCMITEARIKQKQLENQLKLEAKIHELKVYYITFLLSSSYDGLISTFVKVLNKLLWELFVRWNGVVVLKQCKRYFAGYIREKQQQSNESEPWHMPSLIRYKTCSIFFLFATSTITRRITNNQSYFPLIGVDYIDQRMTLYSIQNQIF